jgi:hypothetical protein
MKGIIIFGPNKNKCYTVSELKLSDGGAKISTVGSSDALLFNDDEKLLSGPYSITPLRASLLITRHNRNGVFCVMVDSSTNLLTSLSFL